MRQRTATSDTERLDIDSSRHHDVSMRTTLTLDDDIATALQARADVLGVSLEEAALEVLRVWFDLTSPVERFASESAGETRHEISVDPQKYNKLLDELMVEDYLAKEIRSR